MRVCPACGVDVVERLPGPEPKPDVQLIPVWTTGNMALLALAKSLLDAEGIDYVLQGEELQGLFGVSGLGTDFNIVAGPAQFLVRLEDADRAREAVAAPDEPYPVRSASSEDDGTTE